MNELTFLLLGKPYPLPAACQLKHDAINDHRVRSYSGGKRGIKTARVLQALTKLGVATTGEVSRAVTLPIKTVSGILSSAASRGEIRVVQSRVPGISTSQATWGLV